MYPVDLAAVEIMKVTDHVVRSVAWLFLQILSFPSDLVIFMCVGVALLLLQILLILFFFISFFMHMSYSGVRYFGDFSLEIMGVRTLSLFCILTGNRNVR